MKKNTRYSFFQLFGKGTHDRPGSYKLVIPIIQRDYAQGRDNEKAKEVRSEFLSQLSEYINTPFGSYDLDFVYGISSPASDLSKKKEFVPLDGQQRLTTLFLIHLYLAVRALGTTESDRFFKTMQVNNGKLVESLFTYHTRTSAVEFCNGLIDIRNNFYEVFELDKEGKRVFAGSISDYIRNSNWFYPDWYQDPTVKGMLTMLDAIHDKFDRYNHHEALCRLMSDDDPAITFIFMSLEDYKLTDDLYIKMNSRGKPLTPFENFKAKYEQYIAGVEKYDSIESIESLQKEIASRENKLIKTVKDNFSFNIDTDWAKLFWEFSRKEIQKRELEIKQSATAEKVNSLDRLLSDTLDKKISRFIKMSLTNQYALEHTSGDVAIPRYLVEDSPLSFAALERLKAVSADGVVLLTRLFELYSSRPVAIMPEWTRCYFDEKAVFEALVNGKKDFTFPKRFMLYAYLMFRLKFGDECLDYLTEWMRFIYNVTLDDNSIQVISRDTYQNAVSSANTLLSLLEKRTTPSIVELLDSEDCPQKIVFFPEYQYKEEILKSSLFNRDSKNALHSSDKPDLDTGLDVSLSWGEIILKLESHPYFTGQIGFILKMAGISDYYTEYKNLNWSDNEDAAYKAEVVRYGRLASIVFEGGYTARKMAEDSLFERAMLSTHPDYLGPSVRNSANGSNLLSSTNKSARSNNLLRDLSWKSFLRLDAGKPEIQDMVKDLFLKLDVDNPAESLLDIVKKSTASPQWRNDLVKYGYLMGLSRNGYLGCTDDCHRILNNSIYFTMWDHEIYSYILYNEFLYARFESLSVPGFWLGYETSNSWSEIPFVKISNGDLTIKVKSYVEKVDGELICHYLWIDSNGNQGLEKFLEDKGFTKKTEEDTVYRRRVVDWDRNVLIDDYRKSVADNVLQFVSELSSFLNENTDGQQ